MSIIKKLFDIQKMNLSVKKDGKNPHFKNEYITLDKLVSKLQPICNELGLLIIHKTINNKVITEVVDVDANQSGRSIHLQGVESGKLEEYVDYVIDGTDRVGSCFPLGDISNPQKVGSAITYAKRYNLCQIFNIITDRDDDGNQASEKKEEIKNDKPFFTTEAFNNFKKVAKTYSRGDQAISNILNKYQLNTERTKKVLALYT